MIDKVDGKANSKHMNLKHEITLIRGIWMIPPLDSLRVGLARHKDSSLTWLSPHLTEMQNSYGGDHSSPSQTSENIV